MIKVHKKLMIREEDCMIKILDNEYKCAYKEVYIIIENLDDEIRNKIPKEKIEFYKNYMDKEHIFELDLNKELSEQNILYPTKCILANLFRDYIATEEDRVAILKEEKEELNKLEEEKRKKYNPDDIFKNNLKEIDEKEKLQVEEINTNIDLMVQNENMSFFEKIKNKLIKFINKFLK